MAKGRVDVVVVGAGVAGLATAATLAEEGLEVEVLEARERVGGRVWTVGDEGAPAVELGAEFVHGEAPLTRALLAEAGAAVVPFEGPSWQAEDGRVGPGRAFDGATRVLESVAGDPRSFEEAVADRTGALDARDVEAARAFVEGFFAADAGRARASALAEESTGDAMASARVPAGQRVVPERLQAAWGGRPRLGWIVERIRWRPGSVAVEGKDRVGAPHPELTARAAVVTVPLGVLQAPAGARGAIAFEPHLPGFDALLARLGMGPAVRMTLRLERAPWGEPPLLPRPAGAAGAPGFLHTPGRAFNVYWTAEPPDAPLLVAWSGGGRSRGIPAPGPEARALPARELAAATGLAAGELEGAVVDVLWHDWRVDPFSRGAYSYPVVGGEGAPEALARPVEGTVFFAGEATWSPSLGTVEGALASGRRAAERVVAALGRS